MEQPKQSIFKKPWVQSLTGIIIIILLAVGVLLYKSISARVSVDNSLISAPVISIAPQSEGILGSVYVREGDNVVAGQVLARVGAEVLRAQIAGVVISVENNPGQVFQPGQEVIKMIDPSEFRIVGTVKENAGLSSIAVGDPVSFTVDAFGSKKFAGVVDSISPTASTSGVVFTISDTREVQDFDVKVKYDISANPLFKNGMSAKMKIYIKNQ